MSDTSSDGGDDRIQPHYHTNEGKSRYERVKKLESILELAQDKLAQHESHELEETWAEDLFDYKYVQGDLEDVRNYHALEPRNLLPKETPVSPPTGFPRTIKDLRCFVHGLITRKEPSTHEVLPELKRWQTNNLHPDDLQDLSGMWLYRETSSLHEWLRMTPASVQGEFLATAANYQLAGRLLLSTGFDTAMTRAEMGTILDCMDKMNIRSASRYLNYLQTVLVTISQNMARILHIHMEYDTPYPKLRIIERERWHFTNNDSDQNSIAMNELTAMMMALPKNSAREDPNTTQIPPRCRTRFLGRAKAGAEIDRDYYADEFLGKYVDIDRLEHLVEKKPWSGKGVTACICDEEPILDGCSRSDRKKLEEYKKSFPLWCREERHLIGRVRFIIRESRRLDVLTRTG